MFPLRDNIPTNRPPYVTLAIIAANVLVYFLWQRGGLTFGDPSNPHFNAQLIHYGVIPCNLSNECTAPQPHEWLTPLTAMFMHAGLLHLGGNMLFLWIFGNNVEDSMGRVRFVVFYLLGGLAATALQIAVSPGSAVPNLGASGAIAAVLGGYLLLYPGARVLTFMFLPPFVGLMELPALVVLGLWIILQVFLGATGLLHPIGESGGGVAYFAHIGGFVFGLALVRLFAREVKDTPPRLPVY